MGTLRTATICLALGVALLGCASNEAYKDIQVETELNPKVDIDGYENTYAWAAAAAMVREGERRWSPPDLDIGSEIMFLVDRELRDRGWTQVAQSPAVGVIYGVGVDMMAIEAIETDDEDAARFERVPKGGVLIVLTDPGTSEVIWAGSAVADISEEPSVELAKKRLDYAITEMFKKFPR
jgi:hypothetical protein